MPSFKDMNGREWHVNITAQDIVNIKKQREIDLMQSLKDEGQTLYALTEDNLCEFINILFLICEDQAQKTNITDVDFGKALGGKALEDATNTFIQAFIEFLPPKKKIFIEMIHQKRENYEAKAMEHVKTLINSPEIDTELEKNLMRIGERAMEKIREITSTTTD